MKLTLLCMLATMSIGFAGCQDEKTNDDSDSITNTDSSTDTDTDDTDTDDTEPDPNDVDDDGDGITENDGDCDDENAEINPSADDTTVDGVDQNCDGFDGIDNDGDGYATIDGGGSDCNDDNPNINPSADETCNAIDDNCDGTVDSSEVCPCSLTTYEGHNYLYCEIEAIWSDAQALCTDNPNYDLLVVNDSLEQSWISTTASTYQNRHWWLGLTDLQATEDQEPDAGWMWVDGTPLSYSNWSGGQPDNYDNREDCAHMDLDSDETNNASQPGGWNDLPCEQSLWFDPVFFICESTL